MTGIFLLNRAYPGALITIMSTFNLIKCTVMSCYQNIRIMNQRWVEMELFFELAHQR